MEWLLKICLNVIIGGDSMSNLGKNIKSLRKEFQYNQKDLAGLLGVSQTSVAHYEAGTRQPSIETLMTLSQLFNVSIDKLVGLPTITVRNNLGEQISKKTLIELLIKHLLEKDEKSFLELFETNVFPNYDVTQLLDSVLKTVMYRIGDLWENGQISEADEHYATNIVRKVLHIVDFNIKKTIKGKKAISLIAGSEKHSLGIEMVNSILELEGVEPIYLGGNLPIRSIEQAIKEKRPNYIFISITLEEHMNSLNQLIDLVNSKFKERIKICVGGQGVKKHNESWTSNNVYLLKSIKDIKHFLINE